MMSSLNHSDNYSLLVELKIKKPLILNNQNYKNAEITCYLCNRGFKSFPQKLSILSEESDLNNPLSIETTDVDFGNHIINPNQAWKIKIKIKVNKNLIFNNMNDNSFTFFVYCKDINDQRSELFPITVIITESIFVEENTSYCCIY